MDGRSSGEEQSLNEEAKALITRNDVQVVDVGKLINAMQGKLGRSPELLTESAGGNKCCIFRAHKAFFSNSKISAQSYQPRAVSIGPYHHGKPRLKMMQEHKWRFLKGLIKRTENTGVGLEEYVKAVKGLEEEARKCYAEAIKLTSDAFVEMLVLDGCFVVEMFRVFDGVVRLEYGDPFYSIEWIYCTLHHDFLCLENQIPYIVLQRLFTLTEIDRAGWLHGPASSLANMALRFLRNQDPEVTVEVFRRSDDIEVLHLLNLLRQSYFPVGGCLPKLLGGTGSEQDRGTDRKVSNIQCISKLRRAGIKLKLNTGERRSFLEVEFKRGVICMPQLKLDDNMCSFLLNCVAYEQCHKGTTEKFVTEYAVLLDRLIDTHKDVDILCEANVLDHCLETKSEVAAFVGKLAMAAVICADDSYLRDVYAGVNNHYRNQLHIYLAEVKHKYFGSPWSLISLLAAIFLLCLTVVQTIFAVWDLQIKRLTLQ